MDILELDVCLVPIDVDITSLSIAVLCELRSQKERRVFQELIDALDDMLTAPVVESSVLVEILDNAEFVLREISPAGYQWGYLDKRGWGYWKRDKREMRLDR